MKYELENKAAGWKLKCPTCNQWLYLDDDQFNGRISTWHDTPECGYHETVNYSELATPNLKEGESDV